MRAFPPLRSLVVGLIFVLSRTALAQSLRLSDVIGAAKHENLDLKVLQAKLDALSARDSGSTNLPPPMLNLSSMGTDGPFRSGSMREQPSYGISQTIPFPTKIIASGAATSSAFKAGEADKEYEERLVLASVKVAFWDYLHAYQEKQVKEDQLKVLKDHLKRIVRSPVSDTLTNSHILGIKNEISAMESELDDSALKMHRARNVLSVLTGLSAQTLAGHPEEPPPSIVPSVESVRRDNPPPEARKN